MGSPEHAGYTYFFVKTPPGKMLPRVAPPPLINNNNNVKHPLLIELDPLLN